jgi:quinol monooxygenase YgiN
MTQIITYIDFEPKSTSEGIALLQKYREATTAEEGNTECIGLRETSRPNRFVIVAAWGEEGQFQAHEAQSQTVEFRSKLKAIHNSPYDQRVHHAFAAAISDRKGGSGALYVVTHVDVPPPRREETELLLNAEAAQSRSDDGNVRYDVFQQNAPRTNHFTVFAVWKDEDAFDSHQATTHTRAFREALGPMLGAPYDERLYAD